LAYPVAGRDRAMPDDVEQWPELLRVEATGDDTDPVIVVDGELDASGTRWFEGCVAAALQKRPGSIAIDAGGLTYMDSSGLRSLLVARAAAEEAGVAFRISQPSPALRHVVERTGLQGRLLDE
jgi:anti-sigma B factor antagonist